MKKAAMLKILLLQGANLTFLGRRGRGVGFASATNAGKDWHSAPPSTAGTICTKLEALDDRHPKPDRVWNRIPDEPLECREYSYEPDMCGVIRYFTTTSEHPARSRSA
jgi:hypothetical protein